MILKSICFILATVCVHHLAYADGLKIFLGEYTVESENSVSRLKIAAGQNGSFDVRIGDGPEAEYKTFGSGEGYASAPAELTAELFPNAPAALLCISDRGRSIALICSVPTGVPIATRNMPRSSITSKTGWLVLFGSPAGILGFELEKKRPAN
jgi:hypothetical protein